MADSFGVHIVSANRAQPYKNGAPYGSVINHASATGLYVLMSAHNQAEPHVGRFELRDEPGGTLLASDDFANLSAWTNGHNGASWTIDPAGFAHGSTTQTGYGIYRIQTSGAAYVELQDVTFDGDGTPDGWVMITLNRADPTTDSSGSSFDGYRVLMRPSGSVEMPSGTALPTGSASPLPTGLFRYPYEYTAVARPDDPPEFVTQIMDRDRALEDYVSATAGLGSDGHDALSNVTEDQHHPKSHTHSSDGSGSVAHSSTTGQTTDDHHAKSHAHDGSDGSGTVSHADLDDLTAGDPHTQYLQESLAAAKGDILVATANDVWAVLTAGTDDQVLTADSGEASGLKWADSSGGSGIAETLIDAKGDLIVGSAADTAARLAAGADGLVLTTDAATATGLKWGSASGGSGIAESLLDAKGDIIVASADDTAARLAVGATDGHVLTVDAAEATGLKWAAAGTTERTLGYAEVTSSQGSITSEADLTGLSVTVDVPAGARIRITGDILVQGSTNNNFAYLRVKESTTDLQVRVLYTVTTADVQSLSASVVLEPSTGSHTYKLSLARNTGTGTLTMVAGATFPAFILVEDIT